MRLIDADALIDKLKLYVNGSVVGMIEQAPTIDAVPATIDSTLGYLYKVGWIQEHDRIMTEDAAPVRHGWWDTSEDNRIVCSECTHGAPYMYKISDKLIMQELTYYCPYCGARMDGEDDETN